MSGTNSIRLEHVDVKEIRTFVDREKAGKVDTALDGSLSAELRLPREETDHTFLVVARTKLTCEEVPDHFDAEVTAYFYFSHDGQVEDYERAVQENCVPVIQERSEDLVKQVLAVMGHGDILSDRGRGDA